MSDPVMILSDIYHDLTDDELMTLDAECADENGRLRRSDDQDLLEDYEVWHKTVVEELRTRGLLGVLGARKRRALLN